MNWPRRELPEEQIGRGARHLDVEQQAAGQSQVLERKKGLLGGTANLPVDH